MWTDADRLNRQKEWHWAYLTIIWIVDVIINDLWNYAYKLFVEGSTNSIFSPLFKVDATFVNRVDIMFFFSDMYFDSLETM